MKGIRVDKPEETILRWPAALSFHSSAAPFLLGLGFELTNNPEKVDSPYGASSAVYRASTGLMLIVGFDSLRRRRTQAH